MPRPRPEQQEQHPLPAMRRIPLRNGRNAQARRDWEGSGKGADAFRRSGRDGSARSRHPSRCKPRHHAYERRYAANAGWSGKVAKIKEEKE